MNINENHENRVMNGKLWLLLIFMLAVVPFTFAATPEQIKLENCQLLGSGPLACGQTATATCDAEVTYGDAVVAEVRYTIGGTSYNAQLTGGSSKDGTWQYTYTVQDETDNPSFTGATIRASGPTSSGVSSCSSTQNSPVNTNSCKITWSSPVSFTSSCDCTYTTTSGQPNSDDEATFTRTPSAGCEDQSVTTWTQTKDFCDPEWTATYGACVNGKATKNYVAQNPSCTADGNNIWFRHNTGSDQTPPIDAGTQVSCRLVSHNQFQYDERSTGSLETEVSTFSTERNTKNSISHAARYPPIVKDVDGDGEVEMLTTSSSSIRLFTYEGGLQSSASVSTSGQPAYWEDQGVFVVPATNELRIYSVTGAGSLSLDHTASFNGGALQEGVVRGVTCYESKCYFGTAPSGSETNSYGNYVEYTGSTYAVTSQVVSATYSGGSWVTLADHLIVGPPVLTQVDGTNQVAWLMETNFVSPPNNGAVMVTDDSLTRQQRFLLNSEKAEGASGSQTLYRLSSPMVAADEDLYVTFREDILDSGQEDGYLGVYLVQLLPIASYTQSTQILSPQRVWTNEIQDPLEGISNPVVINKDGYPQPAFVTNTQSASKNLATSSFDVPQIQFSTVDDGSSPYWGTTGSQLRNSPGARYTYHTDDSHQFYVDDMTGPSYSVGITSTGAVEQNRQAGPLLYDHTNRKVFFSKRNTYALAGNTDSGWGVVMANVANPTSPFIERRTIDYVESSNQPLTAFAIDDDKVIYTKQNGLTLEFYEVFRNGTGFNPTGGSITFSTSILNRPQLVAAGEMLNETVFLGESILFTGSYSGPADATNLAGGYMESPASFNYDFSTPRYVTYDSGTKSTRRYEITQIDPVVTTESSPGVCENFYPLVYNSDSYVLGIDLNVTSDETIGDVNDGPLLAYCDFSNPNSPEVTSLGIHVPGDRIDTYTSSQAIYDIMSGSGNQDPNVGVVVTPAEDNERYTEGGDYVVFVHGCLGLAPVAGSTCDGTDDLGMTITVDGTRVVAADATAATTAYVYDRNLGGRTFLSADYAPRQQVTSGDWDGDGDTDIITNVGVFLHEAGDFSSEFGPVQDDPGQFSGFIDFSTTTNSVNEWTMGTDLNADTLMDLVVIHPTQTFFDTYITTPEAVALQQGALSINSFKCSVRPNSNTVDARLLTTAPDPDSMSVQFRKGDGTGTRSVDTSTDGQYTLRYDNAGEYTLRVIVNSQAEATCNVVIENAPGATCSIGADGEFNYPDTLSSRGWKIDAGSTDIRPSGGVYTSTINDVRYTLNECDFGEVTVEFGIYPGRNSEIYINGISGSTAGMKFLESSNAITTEDGQNLGDYPTQDKINARFVIDVVNSQISYYIGNDLLYAKDIDDFRLASVQIRGRVAVDFVRVSTADAIQEGSVVQTPEDQLEGDSAALNNCNATSLKEAENISTRLSAPNVRAYCNSIEGCSLNELRNVINANPECSKEAYNYCTTSSASQNTGIAQGTQCATLLAAGSALNQVGFPVISGIWDIITQNALASVLILMIVVISVPIWVKRRK